MGTITIPAFEERFDSMGEALSPGSPPGGEGLSPPRCLSVAERLRCPGGRKLGPTRWGDREKAEPGWVARGPRRWHKQPVSHKHRRPHQPHELGSAGVFTRTPPCRLVCWAQLPSQLPQQPVAPGSGLAASRGSGSACSCIHLRLPSPAPEALRDQVWGTGTLRFSSGIHAAGP